MTPKTSIGVQSSKLIYLILIINPVFPWTAMELFFKLLGEIAAVVKAVFSRDLSNRFTGSD